MATDLEMDPHVVDGDVVVAGGWRDSHGVVV